MKSCAMRSWGMGVLCIIGSGISQAAPASDVLHAQPSAPRITCTIRMNFWCIVQADASLNMTDLGDYRTWKMMASGSKREAVTIRENKSCDSPAGLRPRKKFEKDERLASGERRHVLELAISADGACTLRVEYIVGDTDLAREALQIAKYRLYLCSDGSCRRPLLDVR